MLTTTLLAISLQEYAKRHYAKNISEYNTIIGSLIVHRRYFFMPYVYDDMFLDGVQPIRDTFHTLIVDAKKGYRLQDVVYFMDEIKYMGLMPNVSYLLYESLLLLRVLYFGGNGINVENKNVSLHVCI